MSVEITAALTGSLAAWGRRQAKVVDQGVRVGLWVTARDVQKSVVGKIRRARFRSSGLSSLVKFKVLGRGLDRQARIYSVARLKGGAGGRDADTDLVALFGEGATIRAAGGSWLAIPTGMGPLKSGGRGRRRFATLQETIDQRYNVAVVPSRGGNKVALLTYASGRRVVSHVLVREIGLRRRYTLDDELPRAQSNLYRQLAAALDRADKQIPETR